MWGRCSRPWVAGGSVPGLAGRCGCCPSPRARTGGGCFLPTLLPFGDGCAPAPPVGPENFRNLLSPPRPHQCVSKPPAPYLVIWLKRPPAPCAAPGTEGGDGPVPTPAPACTPGREEMSPPGQPSAQSPPVLREAGCRLPPSPAPELPRLEGGAAPAPPAGRMGAPVRSSARRPGSLSSSASVWCSEPALSSAKQPPLVMIRSPSPCLSCPWGWWPCPLPCP